MSGIRFEFDPSCLPEVMRSQQVRGALRQTAEEILPRAKALARAEGFAAHAVGRVVEGPPRVRVTR